MEKLKLIEIAVLIAVGCYDVLLRVIPTIGDYTVIGNIFKFLKWVSDYFNNTKTKTITVPK